MPRLEYDINFSGADNGFVVRIGCKTLVFEEANKDKMLSLFTRAVSGDFDQVRRELFPVENICSVGDCRENAEVAPPRYASENRF